MLQTFSTQKHFKDESGLIPTYNGVIKHLLNEPMVALYYGGETIFAADHTCRLYMPWSSSQSVKMAFLLPKDSVYRQVINYQMMKLVETGIVQVMN